MHLFLTLPFHMKNWHNFLSFWDGSHLTWASLNLFLSPHTYMVSLPICPPLHYKETTLFFTEQLAWFWLIQKFLTHPPCYINYHIPFFPLTLFISLHCIYPLTTPLPSQNLAIKCTSLSYKKIHSRSQVLSEIPFKDGEINIYWTCNTYGLQ